jgi:hypothetical protein
LQSAEFAGRPQTFGAFTGNVDYTTLAVQQGMNAMTNELVSSRYIRDCDNAWWPVFQSYAADVHAADTFTAANDTYVTATEFYSVFDQFLADARGARFVEQVRGRASHRREVGVAMPQKIDRHSSRHPDPKQARARPNDSSDRSDAPAPLVYMFTPPIHLDFSSLGITQRLTTSSR